MLRHTGILCRNFVDQIYVAVGAASKSSTVFGAAFGAEHDQDHITQAIAAVSARLALTRQVHFGSQVVRL
jgi:hypothetical protein